MGRSLHPFPHSHPQPFSFKDPEKGAAGGEGLPQEGLSKLLCGLGPGRPLPPQLCPRQAPVAQHPCLQQRAAAASLFHGHQQHPEVATGVGRVAQVVDFLHPRAAQQTGTLVGKGVKGELAVVPAHPAGSHSSKRKAGQGHVHEAIVPAEAPTAGPGQHLFDDLGEKEEPVKHTWMSFVLVRA